MAEIFLNGFTCHARVPSSWHTGTLCILVETDRGLVLVDTGPGLDDYFHKKTIHRIFQAVTIAPMDPAEAMVHQLEQRGVDPEDVRDIVLAHMHFDHCGGIPDFPHARIHVHRAEYEAFNGRRKRWTDFAYIRRHIAHQPEIILYEEDGGRWFDFPAIRLPFEPEMWLVPLFGHTRGHCGVALHTDSGWLFHVADAAPIALEAYVPAWLEKLVLGHHAPHLRKFQAEHPDTRITTGHMWLDFFKTARTVFIHPLQPSGQK